MLPSSQDLLQMTYQATSSLHGFNACNYDEAAMCDDGTCSHVNSFKRLVDLAQHGIWKLNSALKPTHLALVVKGQFGMDVNQEVWFFYLGLTLISTVVLAW